MVTTPNRLSTKGSRCSITSKHVIASYPSNLELYFSIPPSHSSVCSSSHRGSGGGKEEEEEGGDMMANAGGMYDAEGSSAPRRYIRWSETSLSRSDDEAYLYEELPILCKVLRVAIQWTGQMRILLFPWYGPERFFKDCSRWNDEGFEQCPRPTANVKDLRDCQSERSRGEPAL